MDEPSSKFVFECIGLHNILRLDLDTEGCLLRLYLLLHGSVYVEWWARAAMRTLDQTSQTHRLQTLYSNTILCCEEFYHGQCSQITSRWSLSLFLFKCLNKEFLFSWWEAERQMLRQTEVGGFWQTKTL